MVENALPRPRLKNPASAMVPSFFSSIVHPIAWAASSIIKSSLSFIIIFVCFMSACIPNRWVGKTANSD